MRDTTFTEIEYVEASTDQAGNALVMDEDAFRAFYDRTARPLWAYLCRLAGDPQAADDLLQETYYRFLRARVAHLGDTHQRHYLFRIGTNLVRDERRRRLCRPGDTAVAATELPAEGDAAARLAGRADLARAMARLRVRERALLWLAYANGSSHREIAATLGVKTTSIKPLLFRARRKLAALLRGGHRYAGEASRREPR